MSALLAPGDLPKRVPGEILCASDVFSWKDVGLRAYRYKASNVEVPAMRDFTVVTYQRGPTRMERRFHGKRMRTRCNPGDVSLLTRGRAASTCRAAVATARDQDGVLVVTPKR